jgi:hypothetical protein
MPEIQERFGELRVFDERLLIELNGVRRQAALLADQSRVVIQLGALFSPRSINCLCRR